MNSLTKMKGKLVGSIIAKIVIYFAWIPIFIYSLGHVSFILLGCFACVGGLMNLIINAEYGRIPYIFYMGILHNKKHGYFFYRTTEDKDDVDIIIYRNMYIYWERITRISIPHKDMEIEGKERFIYKKIDKALDEEFTTLQEKEQAKRNRIRNKNKVNDLLSPKTDDSNKTFIKELKKLENE